MKYAPKRKNELASLGNIKFKQNFKIMKIINYSSKVNKNHKSLKQDIKSKNKKGKDNFVPSCVLNFGDI